ncbi:hypothetical protein BY996DRAFT_6410674 [Phakopsora pachyrhizi]|nr:hypothetical protein BY996DRAFT_6410674 [Phakopsora pachyrhizi]
MVKLQKPKNKGGRCILELFKLSLPSRKKSDSNGAVVLDKGTQPNGKGDKRVKKKQNLIPYQFFESSNTFDSISSGPVSPRKTFDSANLLSVDRLRSKTSKNSNSFARHNKTPLFKPHEKQLRNNAISKFYPPPLRLNAIELKISPRITGGESSWSPSAETLKNLETTPRLRLQSCPKTTDLLTTRGGLISADSSELIFSEALKTKKIILRNTPSQVNKDSFPFYSLKSQSLSSTGLRVSTIPPQSSISSAAKCSTSGMSKLKDIELSSKFNSNSKTSAVSTPKPPNVLRIEVFPASVSSPESSSPTSDYHSAQFSFDPATASRNNSFNELDDLKCLSNEEGDKDETRQSFRFRDSSTTFTNDLISELQKFDAINALLEETRSKRTFNNGLKAT